MTIYIIGWVLLTLAFAISLFNIIEMTEGKSKVYLLPILVAVSVLLILIAQNKPRFDRYYQVENPMSYTDLYPEAYKEGYQDAISEAILIEVNEYSYVISFDGEAHYYSR